MYVYVRVEEQWKDFAVAALLVSNDISRQGIYRTADLSSTALVRKSESDRY